MEPTLNVPERLHQVKSECRVVLLGPGEAQPSHLQKRIEIRDRLRELGYDMAVLGEEILRDSRLPTLPLALLAELNSADLVLVLDTGVAPLAELATMMPNLHLREIIEVWCERGVLGNRRSTPGDVVRAFDYKLFVEDEFKSCELAEQFIDAANRAWIARAQREGVMSWIGYLPS